jgi:hypothetical protein
VPCKRFKNGQSESFLFVPTWSAEPAGSGQRQQQRHVIVHSLPITPASSISAPPISIIYIFPCSALPCVIPHHCVKVTYITIRLVINICTTKEEPQNAMSYQRTSSNSMGVTVDRPEDGFPDVQVCHPKGPWSVRSEPDDSNTEDLSP